MRLQDRPRFRAGAAVRFPDLFAAARAVRVIAQAGLYPSNLLASPSTLAPKAYHTGAGDGAHAIMVLAFELADHPLEPWLHRAPSNALRRSRRPCRILMNGSAGPRWRTAFIRMPYARERVVPRAIIADTSTMAITWGSLRGLA